MFIYKYKCATHNQSLVEYEMKSIFDCKIGDQYVITKHDINPSKSYFINYKIDILCSDTDIDRLLEQIANLNLYYEKFKIEFIDVKTEVMEYQTRIAYCIKIADLIDGYGIMTNPDFTFVVTNIDGTWYFGQLFRNSRSFETNQDKPHSYSNAMSCELSRTLVNIACGQNNPKLIDPCCGIGTVVIEALDLGYFIDGVEMNYLISHKAKQNLEHLKLPDVITNQDMHNITNKYDVAILDIPYGLMSQTSTELQTGLISKCYQISDKLVLVANEEASELINNTEWKIIDKITVPKVNYMFERYVYILEK